MTKLESNEQDAVRRKLEEEKLRAEIAQLKISWWKRPAYIGSIVPSLLALATLATAYFYNYFDVASMKLETRSDLLEMRIREFEEDSAQLANDIRVYKDSVDVLKELAAQQEKEFFAELEKQGRSKEYWQQEAQKKEIRYSSAIKEKEDALRNLRDQKQLTQQFADSVHHIEAELDSLRKAASQAKEAALDLAGGAPLVTKTSVVTTLNKRSLMIYGANFGKAPGSVDYRYVQITDWSPYEDIMSLVQYAPPTYNEERYDYDTSGIYTFPKDAIRQWDDGLIEISLTSNQYDECFGFSPQYSLYPSEPRIDRYGQVRVEMSVGSKSPWY